MKLLSAFCKWVLSGICALLALALFAFCCLMLWVHSGPRSLHAFTPYIESALAPEGSDYSVKIQDSKLLWDSWEKPVAIHVSSVSVHSAKGDLVASLPEIEISLSMFELLFGKVHVQSIVILHPDVVLLQGDDGTLSLGFNTGQGSDNSLSKALALMTAQPGQNPVTRLRSFSIRHASVAVKNSHAGIFLRSTDAALEMSRKGNRTEASLFLPLTFNQKYAQITGEFSLDRRDNRMEGEVRYTDIPSAVIAAMLPAQPWLTGVHMPLSGWIKIGADFSGNMTECDFSANAGQGRIDFPEQFANPLELQGIGIEGSLSDHFNTLVVQKGSLAFASLAVSLQGEVRRVGDDYGVTGNVSLTGGKVADIGRYWPLALSPHTRKWIVSHISGGTIPEAHVALHFKPGDFRLKNPPDESIDASIAVHNTTVKYLPSHPAVTGVNGVVHITGNAVDARVTGAKYMTGTSVRSARIRLPDLAAPDVRLFLDMDIAAPAGDIAAFLSLPDLDKAKKLHLTQEAAGSAEGSVKLNFIAFSEDDRKSGNGHINYAIEGNLHDVSQPGFLGNRDITDANVELSLNNKGVVLSGKAAVNHVPMHIDLTTLFGDGHETTYAIRCDLPVERTADFGIGRFDFMAGVMGVDASFFSSDTRSAAEARLNLSGVQINLPEHGFFKAKGQDAALAVSTEDLPSGDTRISSFTLTGADMHASGSAEIDHATKDFKTLDFDRLRIGGDDISSLHYERLPAGIRLAAKGESFDASSYVKRTQSAPRDFSYDIDIGARRLILGKQRELNDASVKAQCARHCRFADISATLPGNVPFRYHIAGGKLFSATGNAGELAKALGIFNGMEGGDMALTGNYDSGALSGTLEIKNFSIKGAPVLTRILTVASLTGMVDTVRGNGISFTRLAAPFEFDNGIITLEDAKTHGPALGITAGGTIDTDTHTVALRGTLVPSYTINSLIGNVPVIGNMLMGGSGKGLIAINYQLHGNMDDPSVSINPLSALTPGFIRDIFDIFDKPVPVKLPEAKGGGQQDKTVVTMPNASSGSTH